jgi:hypothetical protein
MAQSNESYRHDGGSLSNSNSTFSAQSNESYRHDGGGVRESEELTTDAWITAYIKKKVREQFRKQYDVLVEKTIQSMCETKQQNVTSKPMVKKCFDTTPVGTIIFFAGKKVPDGYLPCDGKGYNVFEYTDLFKVIGTLYGGGTGTNFKVPDFRGMFLRGTGGNAAPLGQQQNDAIRNIEGQFWGDSRRNQGYTSPKGSFFYAGQNGGTYGGRGEGGPCKYNFSAARVVPTANENRPVNCVVNLYIKYKDFCQG